MAEKTYTYQNTVQRLAGQSERQSSITADTVVRRLKLSKASTRSIAETNVEIKGWLVGGQVRKLNSKCLLPRRVSCQNIIGYLVHYIRCGIQKELTIEKGLVRRMMIGGLLLSREINILVRYVETKGQVVKSFVSTTLNRFLFILNSDLKLVTAGSCV